MFINWHWRCIVYIILMLGIIIYVLKHWDILKAFRIFQLFPLSEKYDFEHYKQNKQ